MLFIRSFLFAVLGILYSILIPVLFLPTMILPVRFAYFAARVWGLGMIFILKITCGITYEIRGKLPKGNYIIASKHQSAWETIVFLFLLKRPVYILKKELLYTAPIISFYLMKLKFIAVNRAGGASSLRKMAKNSVKMVNNGKKVIIFPEGTRVNVGLHKKFQPGILAIYKNGIDVLPVALNSGVYWSKNSFIKKPGKIIIQFLPVIKAGMKNEAFMAKLESEINSASDNLLTVPKHQD